ncbi:MAG: hypothetical protein WAO12_13015 [Venatoribacter sp.]
MKNVNNESELYWENKQLGKSGRYYSVLKLLPITQIIPVLIFFYVFLFGYYKFFPDKILSLIAGVFYAHYVLKAFKAVKISRLTIKEVKFNNGLFTMSTFGGEHLVIRDAVKFYKNVSFFDKTHLKFMFPENNNLIIKHKGIEYYISGKMDGIDELYRLLGAKENNSSV